MGGTVSSGRDNDELVDNLVDNDSIVSKQVENAFRAVDRGHYYLSEHRATAYTDSAWRFGNIHLSAPSIYAQVMEALELERGLSFLNMGSGTGYLSTMVGLILGSASNSCNHGVEFHKDAIEHAEKKLAEFIVACPAFDEYEFCPPQFAHGNCLQLQLSGKEYDRIYCGADCPSEFLPFIKSMLRMDGIAVIPSGPQLLRIQKKSADRFSETELMGVTFAELLPPSSQADDVDLPDVQVGSLKALCRNLIRNHIRNSTYQKLGELNVKRSRPSVNEPPNELRLLASGRCGNLRTRMRAYDELVTLEAHPPEEEQADEESLSDEESYDEEMAPEVEGEAEGLVAEEAGQGEAEELAVAPSTSQPVPTSVLARTGKTSVSSSGTPEGDSGVSLGTSVNSTAHSEDAAEDEGPSAACMECQESFPSVDLPGEAAMPDDHSASPQANVFQATLTTEPRSLLRPSLYRGADATPDQGPDSAESPKRQRRSDSDEGRSEHSSCHSQLQSCGGCQAEPTTSHCCLRCRRVRRGSQTDSTSTQTYREQSSPSSSESSDSTDDAAARQEDRNDSPLDPRVRLNRRLRIREALRSMIELPLPRASDSEEEKERLQNRARVQEYHMLFTHTMAECITSLPLPSSLKDFLLYSRNNC